MTAAKCTLLNVKTVKSIVTKVLVVLAILFAKVLLLVLTIVSQVLLISLVLGRT